MTKNPFINALAAAVYITAIASSMYYVPKYFNPGDSVMAPIAVLSLFVLSAAVMGYVFIYWPARLYLEGEKEASLKLFLGTVGIFAGITAVIFAVYFFFGRALGT